MRKCHVTEVVHVVEVVMNASGCRVPSRIGDLIRQTSEGAFIACGVGVVLGDLAKMADLLQRDRTPAAGVKMPDEVEILPTGIGRRQPGGEGVFGELGFARR